MQHHDAGATKRQSTAGLRRLALIPADPTREAAHTIFAPHCTSVMLNPEAAPLITLADVEAAAAALRGHVADTPFLHSETMRGPST